MNIQHETAVFSIRNLIYLSKLNETETNTSISGPERMSFLSGRVTLRGFVIGNGILVAVNWMDAVYHYLNLLRLFIADSDLFLQVNSCGYCVYQKPSKSTHLFLTSVSKTIQQLTNLLKCRNLQSLHPILAHFCISKICTKELTKGIHPVFYQFFTCAFSFVVHLYIQTPSDQRYAYQQTNRKP